MSGYATLILKGNHIFCGKEFGIISGFVAIDGNRIFEVSNDAEEMEKYIDENTEVINCGDGFIMPGFHDCHVHIIEGGVFSAGAILDDCKTEEDAARRVAQHAQKNPEMPWVLGCGWSHVNWDSKEYPTKKSLDRYVPDRPVFLENEDGHGAWVNSKALEMCNVTKDTIDPEFGTIFKGADGEPTGYLDELAMVLCGKQAFDLPHHIERDYLDSFVNECARNGITSINDMRPFFTINLGKLEIYEELDVEDNLPIRINFASNLYDDIKEAKELKRQYVGGKLHYFGLKQFIDGVAIQYTSLLLDDYSDKKGCRGSGLTTKEKLEEAICRAHREEIPVHLHVTGDAAVRMSLDAIEKARKQYGNTQVKHSLEHIDLISPSDIPRLKALNVLGSMQPEHMAPTERFEDNPYPVRFGKERIKYAWAIGTLMKSGAEIAFGTDYPVAGLNPMNGIKRAVTRLADDGEPEGGWNQKEKISVLQALDAYTLGSAKMAMRENEIGTIEKGKLADIAVLDRSPFEAEVGKINKIGIEYTICDGMVTYTKE